MIRGMPVYRGGKSYKDIHFKIKKYGAKEYTLDC
jgi:hypothetical protein